MKVDAVLGDRSRDPISPDLMDIGRGRDGLADPLPEPHDKAALKEDVSWGFKRGMADGAEGFLRSQNFLN